MLLGRKVEEGGTPSELSNTVSRAVLLFCKHVVQLQGEAMDDIEVYIAGVEVVLFNQLLLNQLPSLRIATLSSA